MITRDRLEHIFGNTWTETVFQKKCAEFATRTDHTVRLIGSPIADNQRWLIRKMNCYAYALGLHNLAGYSRWIREGQAWWVLDGAFVSGLIENEWLIEVQDTGEPTGLLVAYYNGGNVTHIGTILTVDKRVRSKFNIFEFYEHGLLEVQLSFGEPMRYFEQPTDDVRMAIIEELSHM